MLRPLFIMFISIHSLFLYIFKRKYETNGGVFFYKSDFIEILNFSPTLKTLLIFFKPEYKKNGAEQAKFGSKSLFIKIKALVLVIYMQRIFFKLNRYYCSKTIILLFQQLILLIPIIQ